MEKAFFKRKKICCATLFAASINELITRQTKAREAIHGSPQTQGHEGDVMLDLEDLQTATHDMVRRHQIRQKIKARCDHLDKSRYGDDILGLSRREFSVPRRSPNRPRSADLPRGPETISGCNAGYFVLVSGGRQSRRYGKSEIHTHALANMVSSSCRRLRCLSARSPPGPVLKSFLLPATACRLPSG